MRIEPGDLRLVAFGRRRFHNESYPTREDLLPNWDKDEHLDLANRDIYIVTKSSSTATR